MRSLILIAGLCMFLVGVSTPVYAHGEKEHGNPCMEMGHGKMKMGKGAMKHQMMEEGMTIILDTIILMKESATDPKVKAKAAQLEKRFRAHMEKHEKMSEMMHGKGHGMGNPCNPCSSKGMSK
ncbi:hypothetical protein MNBD_NITROSPINAE04-2663 [hydrothermal vent metagenome]|uniref:Uncharacterized protein n=1 Tax=hydrothermal vent metagenome TaxID=652676 RepID=A0A3B1CP64_9ZZZZ